MIHPSLRNVRVDRSRKEVRERKRVVVERFPRFLAPSHSPTDSTRRLVILVALAYQYPFERAPVRPKKPRPDV